ncbi:hypothetical protein [Hymenobacter sp. B1770]|uniref:hypothetical protein n=1 Tax=Hymenobacter sp. B1770 TaxID=1718788 RepID=UPI003CEAC485
MKLAVVKTTGAGSGRLPASTSSEITGSISSRPRNIFSPPVTMMLSPGTSALTSGPLVPPAE